MDDDRQYSLEGARAASQRGQLAEWVAAFLASPSSDNAPLGAALHEELSSWVGPIELPLHRLNRLAGPPGDPVLCPVDDDYWDDRVDAMEELADEGWQPPPVIVAYRDHELVLEDGNHRAESLRRAGRGEVWAVVGFEHPEDCEAFMQELSAS